MEDDKRGSLSQPGLWAEQKFSPWEFITMSLEFDGVPLLCSSCVALKRSDLLLPISLNAHFSSGLPYPNYSKFSWCCVGLLFHSLCWTCGSLWTCAPYYEWACSFCTICCAGTGLAKTFIWVFLLRCYGKTRVNVLVNSILRIHLSLLCLAVAICLWVFYFPRF